MATIYSFQKVLRREVATVDSHFPHQTGADQKASGPAVLHGLMGLQMQELKCMGCSSPNLLHFSGQRRKKKTVFAKYQLESCSEQLLAAALLFLETDTKPNYSSLLKDFASLTVELQEL